MTLTLRPSPADLDLYWIEAFHHPCLDSTGERWRQMTVHQERMGPATKHVLRYGPYARPGTDGSQGCVAWLALRDPLLAEGVFAGWEWSGDFDAEVGDCGEGAGAVALRLGFSTEGNYSRELLPNETFTTPKAFFGFFQGDVEEAGRATRYAAERLFALPWPEGRPPMFAGYCTWSNWQDFEGITNHLKPERLEEEIDRAAAMGVELFILDYDWFPLLGDFWPDPQKFPQGVEPIVNRVKAAGMKLGLWMGFGQAHGDSQVVRENPEFLVTRNGRPLAGGWGMRSLCLGYPPCRDWVLAQVCRVVEQFQADWLKHDFDLIPTSDAHHHAPKATDTRLETIEGYYYIMERLHERFPHLYLDNWTPVMGGADFGNFAHHHSTLMTDWYTPITLRSALYGLGNLFPTTRLHTYLRTFRQEEMATSYTMRSGFFGNGTYIVNDILRWDAQTLVNAKQEIERIKEDRDLFLDGEIYQLFDKQPDHYGWDGSMVYSSAKGQGMAQVFRNHDPRTIVTVRFRGLEARATFVVTNIDTGESCVQQGSTLMTDGLPVVLQTPFTSALLRLQRQ